MSRGQDAVGDGSVPVFTEAAFETFYVETFLAVWTMARRLCGDDSESQDAAQVAYLAVYRHWRDGKLREPPSHLLFRVTQRAAIDVLRARARRQRLVEALPKTAGDWVEGELHDALLQLRPEDATLLMLQAASGFSYEELASMQRQSVSTIRSRLFRARIKLRKVLYGSRR